MRVQVYELPVDGEWHELPGTLLDVEYRQWSGDYDALDVWAEVEHENEGTAEYRVYEDDVEIDQTSVYMGSAHQSYSSGTMSWHVYRR